MRKGDIVVGGEYVAQRGKYGRIRRVLIVENEEYHVRGWRSGNAISRNELYSDDGYVKAHRAWALCLAFPDDVTPREKEDTARDLKTATRAADDAWLAADPMRGFVKGRGVSGGYNPDDSGIVCREFEPASYMDELGAGTYREKLSLVERRHIFNTVAQQKIDLNVAEKERQDAAIAKKKFDNSQALLRLRANALSHVWTSVEGAPTAPFISSYDNRVTLSLRQYTFLLEQIAERLAPVEG